jgi:hypothetical protein
MDTEIVPGEHKAKIVECKNVGNQFKKYLLLKIEIVEGKYKGKVITQRVIK